MNAKPAPQERDFYFEKIGENFDKWISDYDTTRRGLMIQRHLGSRAQGKSCLEVGCGTGKISRMILSHVGELVVSDISEKLALRVGTELGVPSSQQDACALSYPDASFDVIVSSECIEHCPDPVRALQEMARVLKPGGFMVVTTPNKLWYPLIWVTMVTKLRNFAGRENWFFPAHALSVLKKIGLNNVALDRSHVFSWQTALAKSLLPAFKKAARWLWPLIFNFCVPGARPMRESVP